MSDKMDMRISGSSTMPGGEYGKVSISGSGKVQGNLKCESLSCSGAGKVKGDMVAQNVSCSGSVKVEGSMDCREKLSTSGSFQCTGPVEAQELKCSGSFQAMGKVTGGEFRISGAMRAEAGVHCREFRSSGCTRIQGDLEAEHVRLKGITEISGLLNAETIEISAGASSEIGDIGGGTITVRQEDTTFRFFGFSIGRTPSLRTNSIEGDRVELEYTTAMVVRGKEVIIGEGCKIDRVEYTETFQAQPGTVGQAVKI